MKISLSYLYAIKVGVINFLLLCALSVLSYSVFIEYKNVKYNVKSISHKAVSREQYSSSIFFIKNILDRILANNESTVVDSQTFNIIDKSDSKKIWVEYVLEIRSKYLDLIKLIKELNDAKIINRITFLKIEKHDSDKLKIILKTENMVSEDAQKKSN